MSHFYVFVRALVSFTLLAYLLTTLNLSDIVAALKNADPFWLFWTFLLLGIGKLLTGRRWQGLLAAVGIRGACFCHAGQEEVAGEAERR